MKTLVSICLAAAASLHADVIFFNPGNAVGPGMGAGSGFAEADPFTPATNYTLTQVKVPLSVLQNPNNGMFIQILDDIGGPGPGPDVLEQFTIGPNVLPPFNGGNVPPPQVVNDTIGLPLLGGTKYWFTLVCANCSSTINVAYTGGGSGKFSKATSGSSWQPVSGPALAFEIDGSAPEPGTWVLGCMGLLAITVAWRRGLGANT